jgi:hypothetical protein
MALPRWRPTCPSVRGSSIIVVLTGSPDPRQHPFGSGHLARIRPVIRDGRRRGRSAVPVSCRCSAADIGFSGHPLPAGGLGLPSVGLPDTSPCLDPDGITTFHTHEMRPGWVPPVSRGRRCSPGRQKIPDRRLPLSCGQSLHPATTTHRARLTHHEASTEVHAIHPSGLLLARNSRMERGSFGFPSSFAPRRCRRRTSRVGPGHRARALGLHNRHRPILQSASPLATCDFVSQLLLRVDADHGLAVWNGGTDRSRGQRRQKHNGPSIGSAPRWCPA